MKDTKEQSCAFALCLCTANSEKPERDLNFETKTTPVQPQADKQPGKMPWTVYKDVFWI